MPTTTNISEKLGQEKAKQVAIRMHSVIEKRQEIMKKSHKKKEKDINIYQRAIDFQVKDKVWISTKNWKTQRPSHKLDYQIARPFEILEKIGNSYKVKLPDTMKIHDVFSADRLRKDSGDPLPGQENQPQPPIEIAGDQE